MAVTHLLCFKMQGVQYNNTKTIDIFEGDDEMLRSIYQKYY